MKRVIGLCLPICRVRFKIDGGEVRILNDDEILAKYSSEDISHF